MAFAQLTYRESLRDIEACLGSLQGKLYHLGFRGKVVTHPYRGPTRGIWVSAQTRSEVAASCPITV
jgi:hypothetical protein